MALTLIKEDGTAKPDANSYADVADCDAYHAGHLYASAWTAATAENKAAALVMATRLIDSQFQFNGYRVESTQALQWPRERCPDPDVNSTVLVGLLRRLGDYVDSDKVPKPVVDATCEMARELLIADRTAAPPGEGLVSDWAGSDGKKYSKSDTRPIISRVAQAMLGKFGAVVSGGSGAVRLVRA